MKTYQVICFVLIAICIGIVCYHLGLAVGTKRTETAQAKRVISLADFLLNNEKGEMDSYSYIKSIEELQQQCNAPITGVWDANTDECYRNARAYQEEMELSAGTNE